MTSSQEGKDRTKILIHTVFSPKFSESKLNFFLSPPVLQSSGHETSLIIPQKNSTSFIFHILKGFQDKSILAKDKGGKTIGTNRDSPCSCVNSRRAPPEGAGRRDSRNPGPTLYPISVCRSLLCVTGRPPACITNCSAKERRREDAT